MKYLLILVLILCSGCAPELQQRNDVIAKYGNDVYKIPNGNYYIARKADGSVWYIECNGIAQDTVRNGTLIFPAK